MAAWHFAHNGAATTVAGSEASICHNFTSLKYCEVAAWMLSFRFKTSTRERHVYHDCFT